MIKKLAFATDHTAITMRDKIKKNLQDVMGYDVKEFVSSEVEICDYPDYAYNVAYAVVNKMVDRGVLICGTGIGMSIAANKIKGIIAAVCWDENSAKFAAQHNNANIICLGSWGTTATEICNRIKIFLNTPFDERHLRRIKKIKELEKL
jgi:ribose 5-phosphate isomerase B